jgi:histidyl-tRNA synthetase
MGDAAERAATGLLADLRRGGIAADMAFRGNMKKRMSAASKSGAAIAVIIGEDELARGEIVVKNLIAGAQESWAMDDKVRDAIEGLLAQLGRGAMAGRTVYAPAALLGLE